MICVLNLIKYTIHKENFSTKYLSSIKTYTVVESQSNRIKF